MKLIWATRGRTWGFRFLLKGGLADPLPAYDAAFAALHDADQGIRASSSALAVRFEDPLARADRSGRVIRHDFVLLAPYPRHLTTIDDARSKTWPLVADTYARIWDTARPPMLTDQDFAVD